MSTHHPPEPPGSSSRTAAAEKGKGKEIVSTAKTFLEVIQSSDHHTPTNKLHGEIPPGTFNNLETFIQYLALASVDLYHAWTNGDRLEPF